MLLELLNGFNGYETRHKKNDVLLLFQVFLACGLIMRFVVLATLLATGISAASKPLGTEAAQDEEGRAAVEDEGITSISPADLAAISNEELKPTATTHAVKRADNEQCPTPVTRLSYPDTPKGFQDFDPYHKLANSAATPSNYALAFKDLNGTESSRHGYRGNSLLDSYDVGACSKVCDAMGDCKGFNIYYERSPGE